MMKNLVNQNYKNILLGACLPNDLVFANINIREKTLSISFSIVTPTKIDNEYLFDAFSSQIESLPKEDLYDLCEQYNCSPNNLINELFYYITTEEILDLSVFPEEVEINGDEWVFESQSCGQINLKGMIDKCVNEDAYYKLMTLWENYHLQTIDDDTIQEVETIIKQLTKCNQMEWIQSYIKECYYK